MRRFEPSCLAPPRPGSDLRNLRARLIRAARERDSRRFGAAAFYLLTVSIGCRYFPPHKNHEIFLEISLPAWVLRSEKFILERAARALFIYG